MGLSVICISCEPPGRLAAVLKPLRPIADQIVLAIDSRVGVASVDAYASLADQLHVVDFVSYERHLPWLHGQCTAEWILRLDGDEVASAAFLRRLPELLARRDVHRYMVRRSWLHGNHATVLDELPWSADHLPRLVRNDGTSRFGVASAEPVFPQAYVDEPVYHLELLLEDVDARRAKAIRDEVTRPLLVAPGGGRLHEAFHLPELREQLSTVPVPPEDGDRLRRAAAAVEPVTATPRAEVRQVPLAQMDALWAGRAVDPAACVGTVRALHRQPPFAAGETRTVFVEVSNDGGEHWPGGMEEAPRIRVAYRWYHSDGAVHVADGERTGFPGPVAPGTRAVVPAVVAAPSVAGEYTLALDLVYEDVRWFDAPCRIPVRVVERGPAATAPRLREAPRDRAASRRAMKIPRVVHRVWLGSAPMPPELEAMGATFSAYNPGWTMRLWGDEDLAGLGIAEAERTRARSAAELSNIVRYEVLRREGGVYVDTDVECRRDLEPLLRGVRACAALELPGRLGNAVLAAVPGHRVFTRAATESRLTLGLGPESASANGPYFLTLLVEQEPEDFTVMGADVCYPYSWTQFGRAADAFPDAYLVHRWSHSWWGKE